MGLQVQVNTPYYTKIIYNRNTASLPLVQLCVDGIFETYTFGHFLKQGSSGGKSLAANVADSTLVHLKWEQSPNSAAYWAISSQTMLYFYEKSPPIIFQLPTQPSIVIEFTSGEKLSYCKGSYLNNCLINNPNYSENGYFIAGKNSTFKIPTYLDIASCFFISEYLYQVVTHGQIGFCKQEAENNLPVLQSGDLNACLLVEQHDECSFVK